MKPDDVKRLALSGRVIPAPTYHGFSHGIRFETLRTVLAFCFRVVEDKRVDDIGRLRHPDGHVAWCQNWGGEVYRIDFNLVETTQGETIAIVTGVKLR